MGAEGRIRRAVVEQVQHEAAGEAVLFSFSDRPVQKALGLWREEAGNGFKPFS